MSQVPCGDCRLCCRSDAVGVSPEEEALFMTEFHAFFPNRKMIAHKKNRDCIYLRSYGCSIHGKKPEKCREMDCRNIARNFSNVEARKLNLLPIWNRGLELIREAGNE